MRKITLFLMSLFLTVGAMAQAITIEAGKLYRIKENRWPSKYLTIRSYNGNSNGQFGTVPFLDKAEGNADQVFFIEKTDGGYYLKSKSGLYITHRGWCIDACNDGSKGKVAFVADDQTTESLENFHIKNVDVSGKFYKVELIGTGKGESVDTPHPFCDADWNGANFATFNLEVVDDSEFTRTEYVHNENSINRNDRKFQSFTIADGINSLEVTDIQTSNTSPVYINKSDVKFTTTAGATLKFSAFNWIGNAMHAYAYIDYNKDYYFGLGENNNGNTEGELVSYNYYNGKDITGTTYDDSKRGNRTHNNPSYGDSKGMPAFTLPANLEPGEYRMRIKIDWNNLDADKGASDIANNGGCQCDITIVVEDAEPCTITYNYKEGGKLIASISHKTYVGADHPDLVSGLYNVTVNDSKPDGIVGQDGNYDIDVTIGEMPFEYYESYEAVEDANGWYNLVMHSNQGVDSRYRTYLGAGNETNLAWGTNRSLTNAEDDYYWAFVGNPITGFSVVNKAKGEDYVLSSNGSANPVMLEEATLQGGYNTTWQIAGRTSNNSGDWVEAGDWFCLKYRDNLYMNANAGNGNVNFYHLDDNGSGILAVKPLVVNANADYATYFAETSFVIPETLGAKVYYVNDVENGYAKFEQITGVVYKETGVVVNFNTDVDVTYAPEFVSPGAATEITGNLLKGTTKKTLINKDASNAYYALGLTDGVGFYNAVNGNNANEFYNNAFKAYLEVENTSVSALSTSLRFDFDGITTAIEEVETEAGETVIYDLTGRRVNKITKAGVYIINGRKVMVK